ncbi:MAG: DUF1579 domain-containing protein [Acidobacteriota bacterium]
MMKKTFLVALMLILTIAVPLFAQEPKKEMSADEKAMMEAWVKYMTPGSAHKMLDPMVGTFDAKTTMWMAPGAPPMTSMGVSTNHWVLGNRYMQQDFSGNFQGMPFMGVGYTGYDNGKKQYFGSWMDNMSTGVMTSTGNTTDGKTWNFKSTSTDPMTGKDMPGDMKITVTDADHHTMEMWGPGPDGKVFKMMEISYSRKK